MGHHCRVKSADIMNTREDYDRIVQEFPKEKDSLHKGLKGSFQTVDKVLI